MEIKIEQNKENKLLHRKELTGEITFTGATPSNAQVKEEIAKKTGATADLIVMKHIYGAFGRGVASFEAYAYANKEAMDKIEPKKKVKAPAPGAAPAAQ